MPTIPTYPLIMSGLPTMPATRPGYSANFGMPATNIQATAAGLPLPDSFISRQTNPDPARTWLYRALQTNTPVNNASATPQALEQSLMATYNKAKAETDRLSHQEIRQILGKPPLTLPNATSAEAKDRLEYLFRTALPEQLRLDPNNPQAVEHYLQFASQILDMAKALNPPSPTKPLPSSLNIQSKL